jgi:CD36 family
LFIQQSAATRAKTWSWIKAKGVSVGLAAFNQNVHVTKKASEWLFDGYDDIMIDIAKNNPLLDAGNIPFDKFGWFYMVRNLN